MIVHRNHSPADVRALIRNGKIVFAGNLRARVYGKLGCASGKKMKRENRVFFESEAEAVSSTYRPCGHCLRSGYLRWKHLRMEQLVQSIQPAPVS